jgi:hypothetical protein
MAEGTAVGTTVGISVGVFAGITSVVAIGASVGFSGSRPHPTVSKAKEINATLSMDRLVFISWLSFWHHTFPSSINNQYRSNYSSYSSVFAG